MSNPTRTEREVLRVLRDAHKRMDELGYPLPASATRPIDDRQEEAS